MCQIFSRSVQGLRSSDTPKLPFPIDLLRRPYNSVRTAMRQCDLSLCYCAVYFSLSELYIVCYRLYAANLHVSVDKTFSNHTDAVIQCTLQKMC